MVDGRRRSPIVHICVTTFKYINCKRPKWIRILFWTILENDFLTPFHLEKGGRHGRFSHITGWGSVGTYMQHTEFLSVIGIKHATWVWMAPMASPTVHFFDNVITHDQLVNANWVNRKTSEKTNMPLGKNIIIIISWHGWNATTCR